MTVHRKKVSRWGVAAAAAALLTGVGFTSAQQAPGARPNSLETLKQFKVATTDLNIPVVPQEGPKATRSCPTPA
jgi:hypothetical protein